ncbi:hypothetical protein GC169_09810 [bacterium]|nr:hypothetical protein [bacterium]
MDFYNLACDRSQGAPCAMDAWVAGLQDVFPASLLKDTLWGFAAVQAVHLLALGLLGGCVILLNLRLVGVTLSNDPPSWLERNLRPWLVTGVVAVLVTGVIIGMLNPEKLYTSPAFFVKMVSLVAALIFSFGVTNAIARSEGQITNPIRIAAGVAFLFWLWSIGIFGGTTGTNPGTFHLVTAGYLILFLMGRRLTTMIAGATIAILTLVYLIGGYFVIGGPYADYDAFMGLTKICISLGAVVLVGLLGFEIFTGRAGDTTPVVKLIGLFSILSWVTVAASGRWIGLS